MERKGVVVMLLTGGLDSQLRLQSRALCCTALD